MIDFHVASIENNLMKTTVYFISDHTGLTVEALGRTLLSQFELDAVEFFTISYINTESKAHAIINKLNEKVCDRLIVFSSIVNKSLRALFFGQKFDYIDLFSVFLPQLEETLHLKAKDMAGLVHSVGDYSKYMLRIEAINFALAHDDGLNYKGYSQADIILVGVSRSGKTPTSLYLAIQFGIKAANYPITEDDIVANQLPKALTTVREKLHGLLIDPQRLHEIRSERLPNSQYASLAQCRKELEHVRLLFEKVNTPYLDTTALSIEEISTQILTQAGITKRF